MTTREIRSVTAHRSDLAANSTEEPRTVKIGVRLQFSENNAGWCHQDPSFYGKPKN
jgi:hypothetical protein